jgi:hypothetical protein
MCAGQGVTRVIKRTSEGSSSWNAACPSGVASQKATSEALDVILDWCSPDGPVFVDLMFVF